MADTVSFVLALIDKISAPAKAASASLAALQDQLKSVNALLKEMPKLALKVPKVSAPAAASAPARLAREKLGPVFGPGPKEAEKSARYRERLEAKAAKEAERAAAQQTRAQVAAIRDAERFSVGYHIRQIQRAQAEGKAREAAAKILGTDKTSGGRKLLESLGGGRAFTAIDKVKELGSQFEEVTGISAKAAIGIAGVGAAAIVAAVGVAKLVSVVASWTLEGANLALEAAEAKQDTLDLFEAMLGSAEAAQRTLAAIRDITKVTSASQDAVQESASALSAAGVKNEKLLLGAVKAVAQVDSVLKGRGEKIQAAFERAAQTGKFEVNAKRLAGTGVQLQTLYAELSRRTGIGVKQIEAQMKAGKIKAETGIAALTAVIDQKFGPVAEKQAKDLGPQLQRFKDNVSRLFEDVKTGPFLDALDRIISLFDQATPSGAALHDVLTSAFSGLFEVVSRVEPYVKTFLKGLVIIGLQVAIALKPIAQQFGVTFGAESQAGPKRMAQVMSLVGLGIRRIIEVGSKLTPVVKLWWDVFSGFNTIALQVVLALSVGIPRAIGDMIAAIVLAIGWFERFGEEALNAGQNLVTGLIDGVKNSAGQLYDAVVGMASTALDKFKAVFGIHSPSRVMAQMGVNLSAGLAQGISAGARTTSVAMAGAGAQLSTRTAAGAHAGLAAPQVSLSNLIGQRYVTGNDNSRPAPYAEPPRIAPRAEARGGRTVIIHAGAFGPGAIVIQGSNLTAAEIQEMFPSMMADAFELAGLSNGTSG